MPILPIRHHPDPVLKQIAEPVEIIDEALRTLADDMVETMYAAPGVGLAAPQVGVSKRLAVIDCASGEAAAELLVLINPEIIEREGQVCEEEGCLSVPGYYAKVDRSARIRFRYLDLEGQTREREADGLLAICVQHELDHFEGILFIDHLSSLKKSLFRKKYKKILEQQREQM
ncbi:MAG: peptide deformylase [Desulfuromonadaceae bacterium]|jgi:peptide deformylase